MSAFQVSRALFFVLFIVIHAAILIVAALNLTSSTHHEPLRPLDGYLIFYSAASLLFIFPIIIVDVLRRGALTSLVWFECLWLFVSWLMNLSGAASVTALSSVPVCSFDQLPSCSTGQVLIGVTWTATLLVLMQLVLMVVASTIYSQRYPDVWTSSVRDFQWFAGGGSGKSEKLGSRPPSPNIAAQRFSNPVRRLERMAEQWQPAPVSVQQTQAPIMTVVRSNPAPATKADEPQPLTFAYAPAVPPSRAPVHYSATAVVAVGVLPDRRPSKRIAPATAAPSLYPTSVQTAMDGTPAKRVNTTSAIPSSTTRQHAPRRSITSPSAITDEPLPIKGWPRANPQVPYRKERSTAAPVVALSQPAAQPMSVPGPDPSSTPSTLRTRGPRPRPPPLDLSAASPARIR